jgi:hypothetical membrane protein
MNRFYLSISGVIAPVLFITLVIGLGMLEPGYSHMTEMMSVLGGVKGIRGSIFNVGVALTGVLIIAFSTGLHRSIHHGEGSRIGPVMIALGGVGMIGSSMFHCTAECTNVVAMTSGGILHILFSFITGMNLAVSPFFIFARIRKDLQWRTYAWFTLTMGVLANIPGILLWGSFFTVRLTEIEGLIQRLGIVFPLLWIGVMSLRMVQVSHDEE